MVFGYFNPNKKMCNSKNCRNSRLNEKVSLFAIVIGDELIGKSRLLLQCLYRQHTEA